MLLGYWQGQAAERGRLDPVSRAVGAVLAPPSQFVTERFRNTAAFLLGMRLSGDRAEREMLIRDLRAELVQKEAELAELRADRDALREAVGMDAAPGTERVFAEVVWFDELENRITLSVGRNAGVEPDMPVVSADGLAAVVESVSPNQSVANLITSPAVVIGAATTTEPVEVGLLEGNGPRSLILDINDPNAIVPLNDIVVTSGYSETVPAGLLIGEVISVDQDEQFGITRVQVFPSFRLDRLDEVSVLK
jgi:rod shape-determining protein MreC